MRINYPKLGSNTPSPNQSIFIVMEINIADVWEFVSTYYPDYDHCDRIAYSDDLSCVLNGENTEEESKQRVLSEFNNDMEAIRDEYNAVHREIYEKAIQGYLNSIAGEKTVRIVFGSDKAHIVHQHSVYPAQALTIKEFNTPQEAQAYMKGVDDADGWLDYATVLPSELIYPFTGMKGMFNPHTGNTYQVAQQDGEDMPDTDQEPVHLDDIEVSDWWLSLSDEDWKLICQYHPDLSDYTKEDIYNMYAEEAPFTIKQIVSRTGATPDNCLVYTTGTGSIQDYQDNEDFINNVVNQPDCILYVPYV